MQKNSLLSMEQYRLEEEVKEKLVRKVWKQNHERWWNAYKVYKVALKEAVTDWHSWRLSVQAIGPKYRDLWPPVPVMPGQPYEITKVDKKSLRQKVLKKLRRTTASKILGWRQLFLDAPSQKSTFLEPWASASAKSCVSAIYSATILDAFNGSVSLATS